MENADKKPIFSHLPTLTVLLALAFQSAVSLMVLQEMKGLPGRLAESSGGANASQNSALQVGTPAPSFQLLDTQGAERTLEEFQQRKTLLVFSSPKCRYCTDMYPRLQKLAESKKGSGIQILLLQRGSSPQQNTELKSRYGLNFPVLSAAADVFTDYQVPGTPFAVLVDEGGRVVSSKPGSSYEALATVATAS